MSEGHLTAKNSPIFRVSLRVSGDGLPIMLQAVRSFAEQISARVSDFGNHAEITKKEEWRSPDGYGRLRENG